MSRRLLSTSVNINVKAYHPLSFRSHPVDCSLLRPSLLVRYTCGSSPSHTQAQLHNRRRIPFPIHALPRHYAVHSARWVLSNRTAGMAARRVQFVPCYYSVVALKKYSFCTLGPITSSRAYKTPAGNIFRQCLHVPRIAVSPSGSALI